MATCLPAGTVGTRDVDVVVVVAQVQWSTNI